MSAEPLSPAALLAARELLGWSRDRLAARLGISAQPVARYEMGGVSRKAFDPQSAREILEAAGVEFIVENGGGAGVRLKREA